MLVFSGSKQEHLAFIIFPAVLKARSEGTDIPGMHSGVASPIVMPGQA